MHLSTVWSEVAPLMDAVNFRMVLVWYTGDKSGVRVPHGADMLRLTLVLIDPQERFDSVPSNSLVCGDCLECDSHAGLPENVESLHRRGLLLW